MVPIFPPWKKSPLSTLRVCRTPGAQREARVAAVCGFLPRLRVCGAGVPQSPTLRRRAGNAKNAGTIFQPNAEKPRRSGKNPPVREEPASHLASRRSTGSLPNTSNRAEARTHFYKWNIGMQVRIECENPNLSKFTARYGSI